MKELIFFAFLSSYTINFFSDSDQKFRPPGTTEIVDNFFMDQKELTNVDWKEYVDYQKKIFGEDSREYKNALPDTTVWLKNKFNQRVWAIYSVDPTYNEYPVVGISYTQAKDYCVWRTERVNENMKEYGIKVQFKYRLPTRTEWELVAKAGYTNKQKKQLRKRKKEYYKKKYDEVVSNTSNPRNCNMIIEDHTGSEVKKIRMTLPAGAYLPNKYQVFNLYGNVAEMIEEQNVAMGGSYQDKYKDIVPSHTALTYDGPKRWLGFRCVAEVFD